ncbi:MAG: hypothetical protein GY874_03935 [Desulfobacteraceae bacterium]|nr:hypothetical protein [Desulfobacteraceae bacterium]
MCDSQGNIYVGGFQNGLRHGEGMETAKDGTVFFGE